MEKRTDGWYHWRSDLQHPTKLNGITENYPLEEVRNRVLRIAVTHLEASLRMAKDRLEEDSIELSKWRQLRWYDQLAKTQETINTLSDMAAKLDQSRAQGNKTDARRIIDQVESMDLDEADNAGWDAWEQALDNTLDWLQS